MRKNVVLIVTILATTEPFAARAAVTNAINVDTTSLMGRGMFYLAFQLTDGSGSGDANNVVTVSGIKFGGGSVVGPPNLLGGASGTITSAITLTDSKVLNWFIQQFTPGTQFAFQLATTTNLDSTGNDQFSFSILDSAGQELATQAGQTFFNPLALLTIDSGTPSLQKYSFAAGPTLSMPASGNASGETLAFTFADPVGPQDLEVVNILINDVLDGRQACYLAYSQPTNVLYLVDDTGTRLSPGQVLNSGNSINNGQCTVSWSDSPVVRTGNSLVLTLGMMFSGSFGGNKVIYLAAGNQTQSNSGWEALGVWQVPVVSATTTISVTGMSPSRGSGSRATTFSFNFADAKGYQDLGVENILINTALDGRHACYVAYARAVNVLYLVNDNGDALLSGQSLGSPGSISNSQCNISWGAGAVNASGNNLALTLNIGFGSAFGGDRIVYLAARDVNEGNNTGWQAMGTWLVQ